MKVQNEAGNQGVDKEEIRNKNQERKKNNRWKTERN